MPRERWTFPGSHLHADLHNLLHVCQRSHPSRGLIFAGIRMMSGRFQNAIPGLFGAMFGASRSLFIDFFWEIVTNSMQPAGIFMHGGST